jgi:saccharopine dehydrogenase-like NADP-dependent oxidoreductase
VEPFFEVDTRFTPHCWQIEMKLLFLACATSFYLVEVLASLTTPLKVPRVLVIGGTGRVGGSAVRCLHDRFGSEIDLCVAGRSAINWEQFLSRIARPLPGVKFVPLDISQKAELESVIPSFDLVIHTAGPFQGLRDPAVLESSLRHGKQYIDVCDDIALSSIARSKEYRELAVKNGGAAVISTGIWPGGSSLFAQKIIDSVGGKQNVEKVKFTFFTAGTGNAGPTLLAATFLILGEDVLTYVNGQKVYKKSATDLETVDFGKDIGMREVVRLNLIECESCHSSGT